MKHGVRRTPNITLSALRRLTTSLIHTMNLIEKKRPHFTTISISTSTSMSIPSTMSVFTQRLILKRGTMTSKSSTWEASTICSLSRSMNTS